MTTENKTKAPTKKPRPFPNLERVQHAKLRQKIDHHFLKRMRELDDCYYGTTVSFDKEGLTTKRKEDGWKHGGDTPFEGHKPAKQSEAFDLFSKLQALLNWDYDLALLAESEAQGHPYPALAERAKDKKYRKLLGKCIVDTGLTIPRTLDAKIELTKKCAERG